MASTIEERAAALKLKYRTEALKAAVSEASAESSIAETAALNRAARQAAAATAATAAESSAGTAGVDAITSAQPASTGSSAAAQTAAALAALQSAVSSRNSALSTGTGIGARTGATGTTADTAAVSSQARAQAILDALEARSSTGTASTAAGTETGTETAGATGASAAQHVQQTLQAAKAAAATDTGSSSAEQQSSYLDALEAVSGQGTAARQSTQTSAAELAAQSVANLRQRTASRSSTGLTTGTGIGARTGATGTTADTASVGNTLNTEELEDPIRIASAKYADSQTAADTATGFTTRDAAARAETTQEVKDVISSIPSTAADAVKSAGIGLLRAPLGLAQVGDTLLDWADYGANKIKQALGLDYEDTDFSINRLTEIMQKAGFLDEDAATTEELYEQINAAAAELREGRGTVGTTIMDMADSLGNMLWNVPFGLSAMAVSAFGGALEDAYSAGASPEEALANAIGNAGMEVISEKLFGGNPLTDADAGLVNKLIGKLTDNETVMKLLTSRLAEMGGEGLEEVIAAAGEYVVEKATYNPDAELTSDELATSFVQGLLMSILLTGAGAGINAAIEAAGGTALPSAAQLAQDTGATGSAQAQRALDTAAAQTAAAETAQADAEESSRTQAGETAQAEQEAAAAAQQAQITEQAQTVAEDVQQTTALPTAEELLAQQEQENTAAELETAEGLTEQEEQNGQEAETAAEAAEAAATAAGTEPAAAGERADVLSGGNGGGASAADTGGQAGSVAGGAVDAAEQQRRYAEQSRTASTRRNSVIALRLDRTSSRALGILEGTENRNNTVVPESAYDAELTETAEKVRQETGIAPTFVIGKLEVQTAAGTIYVNGATTAQQMIVQADNNRYTATQLADHEAWHMMAADEPDLNDLAMEAIQERFSPGTFSAALQVYMDELRGVYPEEELAQAALEELLANSYAGISTWQTDTAQFQETVRQQLTEGLDQLYRDTAAYTQAAEAPTADENTYMDTLPEEYGGDYMDTLPDESTYMGTLPEEYGEDYMDTLPTAEAGFMEEEAAAVEEETAAAETETETQAAAAEEETETQAAATEEEAEYAEEEAEGEAAAAYLPTAGAETEEETAAETDRFTDPPVDLPAEVQRYVLQEKQRLTNRLAEYEIDEDTVIADRAAVANFADRLLNRAALGAEVDTDTLGETAADIWETAETTDESGERVSAEYWLNDTGEAGEAWTQHFVEEAEAAATSVREAAETGRAPESSRWSTAEEDDDTRRSLLGTAKKKEVRRLERVLAEESAKQFGWKAAYKKAFLDGTAQQLTESWLQDPAGPGQETINAIFEEAYDAGVVTEYSENYEALKDAKSMLRDTRVFVTASEKSDIPDWYLWRRGTFGKLRLVNEGTKGAIGIDTFYQELNMIYPWMFPKASSATSDQLLQMLEVAETPLQTEISLDEAASQIGGQAAAEAAREEARADFTERVEQFGKEISKIRRSTDWTELEWLREHRRAARQAEHMDAEAMGAGIQAEKAQESADTVRAAADETIRAAEQEAAEAQRAADQAAEEARRKRAEADAAAAQLARNTRSPIDLGSLTPERAMDVFGDPDTAPTPAMSTEDVEELAGMNRQREVPETSGADAEQSYGPRESWPTAGREEWEAWKEGRAQSAAQHRLQNLDRDSFTGTASMDALGIRLAGSEANYTDTETLKGINSAAQALDKQIDKLIKRHSLDERERNFATMIAAGFWSEEDAARLFTDPAQVDRVMDLADLYSMKAAVGQEMIQQRKTDIKRSIEEQYDEILQDVDAIGKDDRLIVQNYRTPERNLRHIFGEEMGTQVYEYTFKPAQMNEAERLRWVSSMFDQVRTFAGKDGEQKALSKKESAAVQIVIEGRAAREEVGSMSRAEEIQDAAARIVAKQDPDAAFRELALNSQEQQLAGRLARLDEVYTQAEKGEIDMVRVTNGVNAYTEMFDQMYAAINDFLVAHGYDEIGYIKGYAPHLQPESTQDTLHKVFQSIGLNSDVTSLPTEIAGLTAGYKPGKSWNPYFLSRNTDVTQYDIASAYESYVDYISNVFYHTDDLARVRGLSDWFRRAYAQEEVRNMIDWANSLRGQDSSIKTDFLRSQKVIDETTVVSAAEADKLLAQYIEDKYSKIENTTKYGNLVQWLDNYANVLARKQVTFDRATESLVGRKVLNAGNKLVQTFSRAQVAGNLSSALNQTSQLPLIATELGPKYTAKAVADIANGNARGEFVQQSDFLTGKAGVDYLVTGTGDKILNVLFKPAEFMDTTMATIAVRGEYLKQIDGGATEREAIRAADEFGRAVMGSRMKTERPVGFEAKNPISQMVNVFQVEALNTWEYIAQDLPREYRAIESTKGKSAAAKSLAGTIVAALLGNFVLNRISEEVYGGTPAAGDILGITANFFASGVGLTTNAWLQTIIDNGWEKIFGERLLDTDEDQALTPAGTDEFDWSGASGDLVYNLVNDVPLLRNVLNLFGLGDLISESDQSLPIPDVTTLWDLATTLVDWGQTLSGNVEEDEEGTNLADVAEAIGATAAEFMPAGRQLEKSIQGGITAARGAKYSSNTEEKLQYPLTDPVSKVQAALFGNYATSESDAFYASGGEALSKKNTALYEELVEAGADPDEVYDTIRAAAAADTDAERAEAIAESDLEESERQALLQGLLSDSAAERVAAAFDAGMTVEQYAEVLEAQATMEEETGEDLTAAQQAAAITGTSLSEESRQALLAGYLTESQSEKAAAAYEAGAAVEDVALLLQALQDISDETESSSFSAAEIAAAVAATGAGEEAQQAMLLAWLSDSQSKKAAAAIEAGVSVEDYAVVLEAAASGADKLDVYQAIIDTVEDEAQQLVLLCQQLSDSAALKLETASEYGITAEIYVQYLQALDRYDDGNGSYTQEEAQKAARSISGLTNKERAILWQITGSSWSTDSNPFSTTFGAQIQRAVEKAMAAAEEEEEEEEEEEDESLNVWQAVYLPTA